VLPDFLAADAYANSKRLLDNLLRRGSSTLLETLLSTVRVFSRALDLNSCKSLITALSTLITINVHRYSEALYQKQTFHRANIKLRF
jgi:hypothetical protein